MGELVKTSLVSQWFPPEPVQVAWSIATSLQRRGHSVTVLTGVPNYPDGVVAPGYAAYKATSENIDSLTVRRSPLYPSHDTSALRRTLNYLSWAISTALFRMRDLRRSDVVLVYSSPATAAIPAIFARLLFGKPFVLFVLDLWPDSAMAAGFVTSSRASLWMHRTLTVFAGWTYWLAHHVVVPSPGMINVLESRGVPSAKLSLVYNWSAELGDEVPGRFEARARFGLPAEAFVVSYAGNLGAAQGLDVIIRAAQRLNDVNDVCFTFFGDGVELDSLKRLAANLGCKNVRFLGAIPPLDMPFARAASDVEVVSLTSDRLFEVTTPSKVQAILAAAKPAIIAVAGDAARVVVDAGAGWAVPPGDDEALAAAVRLALSATPAELESMGHAGLDYYEEHMSEAVGAATLDRLLRDAAGA